MQGSYEKALSAERVEEGEGVSRIICGDALTELKKLPDESVHCCVTSPPYWGLRDYGVPGQMGLESTPEDYVEKMVAVFGEVRRVLRDDGVLCLNLGNSYAGGKQGRDNGGDNGGRFHGQPKHRETKPIQRKPTAGLKSKDLIGIPWRVAFALQASGWYLRQDIIWSKPNPMPESVTDRCTKAHEYIFLFAKGQWKSRVVALSDLHSERVHLGQNFRFESPDAGAVTIGIGLASAILNCPEFQQEFGLMTLDPKIWKQRLGDSTGDDISSLPVHCRTAVLATGLLNSDRSPKEFLSELYRLGVTLADGNNFLIGGIPTKFSLPPGINPYGKTAVAVHDSGKICQFDFLHGTIIYQSPSRCNYFYDQEAVKMPVAESTKQWGGGKAGWGASSKDSHLTSQSAIRNGNGRMGENGDTRNRRSVWTITTKPFSESHFATFPPEIPELCIKAGCPPHGTVLDPFGGAGTVGLVAEKLGREYLLIELNPSYVEMAERRISIDCGELLKWTDRQPAAQENGVLI